MPRRKKLTDEEDVTKIDFSNLSFDFDPDKEPEDEKGEEKEDGHFRREYFDDFEEYELNDRYIKPVKCFFKTTAIKYDNARKLAGDIQPTPGFRYDVLVSGSFIFGDFIHAFMTRHHIQAVKCKISTLGMNEANVNALAALMRANYILDLELFVSVYFFSLKRKDIVPYIYRVLDAEEFRGRFQLSVSHIHTKTFQILTSDGRKMIMQGSANLCSSANIEQFIFEENAQVYDFYNEIFDTVSNRHRTIDQNKDRKATWREIEMKKFND